MASDIASLLQRLAARSDGYLPLAGGELVLARRLEKSGLVTLQADQTSPDIVHCTITDAGRELAKDAKVEL